MHTNNYRKNTRPIPTEFTLDHWVWNFSEHLLLEGLVNMLTVQPTPQVQIQWLCKCAFTTRNQVMQVLLDLEPDFGQLYTVSPVCLELANFPSSLQLLLNVINSLLLVCFHSTWLLLPNEKKKKDSGGLGDDSGVWESVGHIGMRTTVWIPKPT